MGIPYFRFSTQMSENVGLDEIDDTKLINLLWETEIYMRQSADNVQALVDLLKCI